MLNSIILLISLLQLIHASIYMGFPFNEQLPNVGRVDEDYTFTMANTTFKSNSNGEISYQVDNLPSWLSFDPASRTFSGKPQESDVGEFEITLTGTDSTDNSQLTDTYTMLVSNDTGLYLTSESNLFAELSSNGQTNGIDGLVVKPGDSIKLQFTKDLFQSYSTSDRPIIAYYGRSADRSSLPNWLSFNGDDLTFSGTVPDVTSENAPSFEYSFSFLASDYYGYAGAQGDFKLVVGGHQLSTSINQTTTINGTFGAKIDQVVPVLSDIYLDGLVLTSQNISDVSAQGLPDYVQFNEDDYTLTGNFPNSNTNDSCKIVVKDIYGNSVELKYAFDSMDSIFTVTSLNDVNATRGEYFQYKILSSLFTDINDTQVTVDFNSDWLEYHDSNMTLTGTTPDDFDNMNIKINAETNSDSESRSFQIKGVDKEVTSSSSSSSSSSSTSTSSSSKSSATSVSATSTESTAASTSSSAGVNHHKSSNNKALAIGLGVGIPVGVILLTAAILLCCCLKRRKNKDSKDNGNDDHEKEFNPRKGTPTPIPSQGANGIPPIDSQEYLVKDKSEVNVMKLEHMNQSRSSSSLTQVETSSTGSFYDADENAPIVKSWRANTESDKKLARASDASLSTVNTEHLFLIRLVDDYSIRNSESSSKFVSNNSLNALLRRESSTNFQRLDSSGNIVDSSPLNNNSNNNNNHSNRSSQSEKYFPPLSSSNLDIVPEEHSRELKQTGKDETTGTISHLLSKFNDNTSSSSSENDGEFDEPEPTPVDDRLPSPSYALESKTNSYNSPSSENFLMGDESTPVNNNGITTTKAAGTGPGTMKHQNLSAISLGSLTSEKFFFDNNSNSSKLNHSVVGPQPPNTLNIGNSAKLVDFTRKGSLRESAYEPDYIYKGESASIQNDDSD